MLLSGIISNSFFSFLSPMVVSTTAPQITAAVSSYSHFNKSKWSSSPFSLVVRDMVKLLYYKSGNRTKFGFGTGGDEPRLFGGCTHSTIHIKSLQLSGII